jgi:glutaredoxin
MCDLGSKIVNLEAFIQSGGNTHLFPEVEADLAKLDLQLNQTGGGMPLPPKYGWILYGYPYCPYCKGGLEYFKENNIPVQFVDITGDKDSALLTLRSEYPDDDRLAKHNTVPIIFHDGNFIGGFSALNKKI